MRFPQFRVGRAAREAALSVQAQFDHRQRRVGRRHRFAQRLLEHGAELRPGARVAFDVVAQHAVGFGLVNTRAVAGTDALLPA